MNIWLKTSIALAASVFAMSAAAQSDYPSKTIELVVGYNAGGAVDTVSRAAAPFLEKHLGNDATIAVINRPGAAGTVASISVSRAKPDGYTLMMFSYPAIAAAFYGANEIAYTLDDFDFLGTVTADPHNLFVVADSPYKSLADILDAAKANPDDVTVSAAGIGGAGHLGMQVLQQEAGVDFNYIPSAGGAGTLTQVLGGHVQAGSTTLSSLVPYVREGELRILASLNDVRNSALPDAPTARDQGVDVVWVAVRGLVAPAGLPDDVRNKLSAALEATMKDQDFLALAEKQGIPLNYMTGEAFTTVMSSDSKRLDDMWATNPWK